MIRQFSGWGHYAADVTLEWWLTAATAPLTLPVALFRMLHSTDERREHGR